MIAWEAMIARLNAADSVANWQRVTEFADVVNMADYYLLNIYMATWDWPHNNWVAARERSPQGRYRLYIWDAEGGMNNRGNPAGIPGDDQFVHCQRQRGTARSLARTQQVAGVQDPFCRPDPQAPLQRWRCLMTATSKTPTSSCLPIN